MRRDRPRLLAGVLCGLVVLTACELTEVTLADGEDVVIAEVVLRAGEQRQLAFLYRTVGTGLSATVDGARVRVSDETGQSVLFDPAPIDACVEIDEDDPVPGSCYRSATGTLEIRPNASYTLEITLAGGDSMTGTTTVPGQFEVKRPATTVCRIDVDSTLELQWTRSDNAWVYVSEVRLTGIARALRSRGVDLGQDPLSLIGLSISSEDTTLVFPTGFGLFDRADPELADALIAIRDGLPPDVIADVVVAAADRNYVNWVRGGNFNPSGQVRVPSVTGKGTGMFGSIVGVPRTRSTVAVDPPPACR